MKFGSYNTETGESQEGYMENGQMKFRRYPWYRRIFMRPPKIEKPVLKFHDEYVGVITAPMSNWLLRTSWKVDAALYKTVSDDDGAILGVHATIDGRYCTFNVNAFKQGDLVLE